jgi:hypothetical protein
MAPGSHVKQQTYYSYANSTFCHPRSRSVLGAVKIADNLIAEMRWNKIAAAKTMFLNKHSLKGHSYENVCEIITLNDRLDSNKGPRPYFNFLK